MLVKAGRAILTGVLAVAASSTARVAFAQDTCASSYENAQELRRGKELARSRAELRLCERSCPKKLADDCSAWRVEVEAQLASVVLDARDADGRPLAHVRVTADGAPLVEAIPEGPVEIDPGTHTLVFEDESGARVTAQVTLAPGEKGHAMPVRFPRPALPPLPPPVVPEPGPAPRSPLSYALGAVGLAGLAVGAALGIKGQVERSSLASSCAPSCNKATQVDPISREWWGGAAAALAGTAFLGAGVAVWVYEGRARAPARVVVGPAWLSISGAF